MWNINAWNRQKGKEMAKILIKKLDQNASLYRDPKNGVAWVEDGNTGLGYSCQGISSGFAKSFLPSSVYSVCMKKL